MDIYVIRDGLREGPYSQDTISASLATGDLKPTDMACQSGSLTWQPLQFVLTGRHANPCPQCYGALSLQGVSPNKGTGAIVIVLGILFAPLCIGVPIFIWGLMLINQKTMYWHCRGCGRQFPV